MDNGATGGNGVAPQVAPAVLCWLTSVSTCCSNDGFVSTAVASWGAEDGVEPAGPVSLGAVGDEHAAARASNAANENLVENWRTVVQWNQVVCQSGCPGMSGSMLKKWVACGRRSDKNVIELTVLSKRGYPSGSANATY